MAKQKRIQWIKVPLLETSQTAQDRVTIDDTLTLFADGDVVINNRCFCGNWFGRFGADAIDFAFPGGHAYRNQGSNRLTIRINGPHPQTLIYEYRRFALVWSATWYQLVQRIT